MDSDNLANKSCDTRSLNKLKLVAVHLGLSDTRGTSERGKELARKICELVMLDQVDKQTPKNKSRTPLCGNAQCNKPVRRPIVEQSCHPAEEAVVKLVKLMEDDGTLNCGVGSNLTMSGHVECDASLMSSRTGSWAGVGAVSGCQNPIELAKSLYDHRFKPRPLGLVQPNLLVGNGSKKWMREHCPHLMIPDSRMISADSLTKYQKFKSAYDAAVRAHHEQERIDLGESDEIEMKLDTVGAIAVDCQDNFACAISSGGITLKHRGRIGQACVPGAGCWAQNSAAVTTTGLGEFLSDTLMAKMFHEHLASRKLLRRHGIAQEISLEQVMKDCFSHLETSGRAEYSPGRLSGVLAISALDPFGKNSSTSDGASNEDGREYYLTCGHNGRSMCIGYMTCNDLNSNSLILEPKVHDLCSPIVENIRLNV